jgi:hypothetical protein
MYINELFLYTYAIYLLMGSAKKWRGMRSRLGGKTDNHLASPRIMNKLKSLIFVINYIGS